MKHGLATFSLLTSLAVAGCGENTAEKKESRDAGIAQMTNARIERRRGTFGRRVRAAMDTTAEAKFGAEKMPVEFDAGTPDAGTSDAGAEPLETLNTPPEISIPMAPKGTEHRMVSMQIVGTKRTSWIPLGYIAAPLYAPTDFDTPIGMMVSAPSLGAAEFTPPADTEEIEVIAGDFHFYWTKHPGKPSKLPFQLQQRGAVPDPR